jgi:hypothetical protein
LSESDPVYDLTAIDIKVHFWRLGKSFLERIFEDRIAGKDCHAAIMTLSECSRSFHRAPPVLPGKQINNVAVF